MIKSDKNGLELRGNIPDLLVELSMIIRGLTKSGKVTREEIERSVDVAFMTHEELHDEIINALDGLLTEITEDLEAIKGFGKSEVNESLMKEFFGEEK